MRVDRSPFSKEWLALQREAQLSAELIGSGVTVVGRANYAQQGYYSQALFNLSIGLERLGKIIYICDFAIQNEGQFPTDEDLRRVGHGVKTLSEMAEEVAIRRAVSDKFAIKAVDLIHVGIIDVLDRFAKSTRYYNLDLVVGGRGASSPDPIAEWGQKVIQPILARHYSAGARERDMRNATLIDSLIGPYSLVLQFKEDGSIIDSVEVASAMSGASKVTQKYTRLYILQIVRRMSRILWDLSHIAGYEMRIDTLAGLNEPFALYYNEDRYFLGRKTWSIYRP